MQKGKTSFSILPRKGWGPRLNPNSRISSYEPTRPTSYWRYHSRVPMSQIRWLWIWIHQGGWSRIQTKRTGWLHLIKESGSELRSFRTISSILLCNYVFGRSCPSFQTWGSSNQQVDPLPLPSYISLSVEWSRQPKLLPITYGRLSPSESK